LNRSISIIVPAYNEEKRLPTALPKIIQFLQRSAWDFAEVILVDDGSTDGTLRVAEQFRAEFPLMRVLRNPGNRGKGYAVRHGMLECRGDWALFTDADLSAPIEELDKLWAAAERENAQVAVGSRALDRALIGVHQSWFRENAGKMFNLVMRLVTGLPYWDTQCGFKLFEARAAQEIFGRQLLDGFGFDVEVLFIAQHLGYRAVEVPVRWNDVQGTKVSAWRGVAAFADPLRVRWHQIRGLYAREAKTRTRTESKVELL
jgi:glycosyltransferase involved in cell wall biosynthesis